jgi:5-methylcytosine-specific restriction endonuclease McrA
MDVTCLHCGKAFKRPRSRVRATVFCSIKCRKALSRPLVQCRGCNATFLRIPAAPQKQYCSWSCFKRSRHVTVSCHVCGVQFPSYLSEARKRADRGHLPCCSRACRNSYTSMLLGGDGTWVPGGKYNAKQDRGHAWRRVRLEYLRLVGGNCEGCCGARAIEVHHLHPVSRGGDMLSYDNLMAVCGDCHDNVHEQIRDGAFADCFEAVNAGV